MSSNSSKYLLGLSLSGLLACGGGEKREQTGVAPGAPAAAPGGGEIAAPAAEPAAAGGAAAYEVAAVTDGGTVSGKVTLTGTAPAPEKIEVTKDNNACGTEKTLESVQVGAGNTLASVVVWLDGIAKGKEWAQRDATIDQKECRYAPYVQAAAAGGNLEIINSDPVMHNIHAYSGEETLFNLAQPNQGQKTPKKLTRTGPVEFKCDVHSWMHAWVFVAANPYYAVTGTDGGFSLADVPPGSYKAKAWHSVYGIKEADVTVAAKGAAGADFTFEAK